MNALVSTDLFDQIFNRQEIFSKSRQEGYPPYNSWIETDGTLKIEIAVSGFSKDELTIVFDGRVLNITGEKKETSEEENKQWLFRGLAKRKFVRQFDIRGSYIVEKANLKNGVLTISLKGEKRNDAIEVTED